MVAYFLDTYALIEIIQGNKNYEKYVDKELKTTIFNLYELYYNLLRNYGEIKAKEYFLQFKAILISFTDETIFSASQFKLKYKKEHISYTDALGYCLALEKQLLFLTGDKAFKYFENVEFVK
ncbi:MAG: PIN domain-containing protein [Nanoarchaeota archaeon]